MRPESGLVALTIGQHARLTSQRQELTSLEDTRQGKPLARGSQLSATDVGPCTPEATSLANLILQSPTDLVVRCRQLLGVLGKLGVPRDTECLSTLIAIDSDADDWPIGVDPSLLEPGYHQRCVAELREFEQRNWPYAQSACQSVLELLSARPN